MESRQYTGLLPPTGENVSLDGRALFPYEMTSSYKQLPDQRFQCGQAQDVIYCAGYEQRLEMVLFNRIGHVSLVKVVSAKSYKDEFCSHYIYMYLFI